MTEPRVSTVIPLDARATRNHVKHADTHGDRVMTDHRADYTQKPAAHGCPAGTDHDREVPEIDLLSPLTIRGVTSAIES